MFFNVGFLFFAAEKEDGRHPDVEMHAHSTELIRAEGIK